MHFRNIALAKSTSMVNSTRLNKLLMRWFGSRKLIGLIKHKMWLKHQGKTFTKGEKSENPLPVSLRPEKVMSEKCKQKIAEPERSKCKFHWSQRRWVPRLRKGLLRSRRSLMANLFQCKASAWKNKLFLCSVGHEIFRCLYNLLQQVDAKNCWYGHQSRLQAISAMSDKPPGARSSQYDKSVCY